MRVSSSRVVVKNMASLCWHAQWVHLFYLLAFLIETSSIIGIHQQAPQQAQECKNETITSSSGVIMSPNHPQNYPLNVTCSWTLRVPSGSVKLTFTSFSVEPSTGCIYDYVQVYDGATVSSEGLGKFCGSDLPDSLESTGYTLHIVLKSDDIIAYSGFNATFETTSTPSWTAWDSWAPCSVTCGWGYQQRDRGCNQGPGQCIGVGAEAQSCKLGECKKDSEWTQWDSWGMCSITCDWGYQVRSRTCSPILTACEGHNKEMQHCKLTDCPQDSWASWNPWSACSVTCDWGYQQRTRSCEPAPGHCIGVSAEAQSCKLEDCQVGTWSPWFPWGPCSVTCSAGVQFRYRICLQAADTCQGSSVQSKACENKPCIVVLGQHDLKAADGNESYHEVNFIVRHNWTDETKYNDIALVRIHPIAEISKAVGIVCMPSSDFTQQQDQGVVTGWGSTKIRSDRRRRILQQVNVPFVDKDECIRNFKEAGVTFTLDQGVFCAGSWGKDSCLGDSGGPLIYEHDDHWSLVGIVSWGLGCGRENLPGVYVNVHSYLTWIKDNSKIT